MNVVKIVILPFLKLIKMVNGVLKTINGVVLDLKQLLQPLLQKLLLPKLLVRKLLLNLQLQLLKLLQQLLIELLQPLLNLPHPLLNPLLLPQLLLQLPQQLLQLIHNKLTVLQNMHNVVVLTSLDQIAVKKVYNVNSFLITITNVYKEPTILNIDLYFLTIYILYCCINKKILVNINNNNIILLNQL